MMIHPQIGNIISFISNAAGAFANNLLITLSHILSHARTRTRQHAFVLLCFACLLANGWDRIRSGQVGSAVFGEATAGRILCGAGFIWWDWLGVLVVFEGRGGEGFGAVAVAVQLAGCASRRCHCGAGV